ncbi:MAG TPA: PilZ domain-containing protein [Albitalea sp.]|nr:PilZ domain-containing protein [Albitalea sp.]
MISGANRRIHPRKVLRGPATIVLPGQPPRDGRTWDVGLDGMSVMSPRPIPPGTRCEVSFDVPSGGKSMHVTAQVKVLYCSYCGPDGFKVGTAFGDLDEVSLDAVKGFTE